MQTINNKLKKSGYYTKRKLKWIKRRHYFVFNTEKYKDLIKNSEINYEIVEKLEDDIEYEKLFGNNNEIEFDHPIVVYSSRERGEYTIFQYTNLTTSKYVYIENERIETVNLGIVDLSRQCMVPIRTERIMLTVDFNRLERNWDNYSLLAGREEEISKIVIEKAINFKIIPYNMIIDTIPWYQGNEKKKIDIIDFTDMRD